VVFEFGIDWGVWYRLGSIEDYMQRDLLMLSHMGLPYIF
jgi:hypothetical protein